MNQILALNNPYVMNMPLNKLNQIRLSLTNPLHGILDLIVNQSMGIAPSVILWVTKTYT